MRSPWPAMHDDVDDAAAAVFAADAAAAAADDDDAAADAAVDDDLHLLLNVPQLLLILLRLKLVGRLDVLKVGDPDLKRKVGEKIQKYVLNGEQSLSN